MEARRPRPLGARAGRPKRRLPPHAEGCLPGHGEVRPAGDVQQQRGEMVRKERLQRYVLFIIDIDLVLFLLSRVGEVWRLGCLIWEVFNGPLPRTSSLRSLGKVSLFFVS